MKNLTLIVAMTPSGLIGLGGKIPWHVPEDLNRFKQLTTNHAIVMGRKTWESIGRPLPNRHNIVVTRKGIKVPEDMKPGTGFTVCTDIEDALRTAYQADAEESPFVIGGGEIYQQTIERATRLEVTFVVRPEHERAARATDYVPGQFASTDVARLLFEPRTEFWLPSWSRTPHAYPSLWDWRCTKIERSADYADVEYHSFERRQL